MTRCTGIIAEYNPLHNGHVYHIERTKSITGGAWIEFFHIASFV